MEVISKRSSSHLIEEERALKESMKQTLAKKEAVIAQEAKLKIEKKEKELERNKLEKFQKE